MLSVLDLFTIIRGIGFMTTLVEKQTLGFKTESAQLLDLMIDKIYKNFNSTPEDLSKVISKKVMIKIFYLS